MASGHVNRIQRPNTWLHRPAANVKKALANPEPSTHGPSRTCRRNALMSAFGGQADLLRHQRDGGRCRDRTYDLSRVKRALSR